MFYLEEGILNNVNIDKGKFKINIMVTLNPKFITDNDGKKLSVILPIEDFEAIMEELDEIEDVKLYDESKKKQEATIPIDDAFKLIEAERNHTK